MSEQYKEYKVVGIHPQSGVRVESHRTYSRRPERPDQIFYEGMGWTDVHVEERTVKIGNWKRSKQ